MNLRELRTLVEIDRIGSFALAADRVGLTLSAVSLQMKALEDDLQLSLFDRTHRPPAMTPVARHVARHARTILSEVNSLRAIGTEPGVLRGEYRIGFVATASVRLMPEFLANAAQHQPGARFVVESGLSTSLLRKVETGLLDAAVITATPDLRNDALFIALRTEAFVLAVPKRFKGYGISQCAGELTHVQFTPTTGIGLLVASYLARLQIAPAKTLEIDSVEAVMGCVNAGFGFAVLPEPDARRYAEAAHLTRLDATGLERQLGLIVRQDGPIAEQVLTLAALFEEGNKPAGRIRIPRQRNRTGRSEK
ncbi:MAG: LysR family transcriptional regulator [Alphaproteobacteria bacterium]|nr:LysR family transcriptional regulator [Alphaproteobacteria bacterium]